MALCKREDGNEAAASDYLEQARMLDPDALEFAGIQAESKARPTPKRSRKKASSKPKRPAQVDEARDAFE